MGFCGVPGCLGSMCCNHHFSQDRPQINITMLFDLRLFSHLNIVEWEVSKNLAQLSALSISTVHPCSVLAVLSACKHLHNSCTSTPSLPHCPCILVPKPAPPKVTRFQCLQGFCAAVSLNLLERYLVTPQDLAEMVSGSVTSWHSVSAIQDVFLVVLDTQLQQEFADLTRCLWEVLFSPVICDSQNQCKNV